MRTIAFDPAGVVDADGAKWWAEWQVRADKATDRALKRWADWYMQPQDAQGNRATPFDPGLQQKVWSELKVWLNENVYHYRCAYCEGPLDSDRFKGDAEHFRPKGRVTFRDAEGNSRTAQCRLPDGTEVDHPGYFWLAYDWRNLVPACADCNSGFGKVDQFPVKGAHALHADEMTAGFAAGSAPARADGLEATQNPRSYFLPPARLDSMESPLLLNPLNPSPGREPSKHLRYGVGGVVVALDGSELGEKSITVYQLRRGALERRRQAAQETLQMEYHSALQRGGMGALDEADRVLTSYTAGQKDFATAALHYLDDFNRRAARRIRI